MTTIIRNHIKMIVFKQTQTFQDHCYEDTYLK